MASTNLATGPRTRVRLLVIYALATFVMLSALVPFAAEVALHGSRDFAPQGDALDWDRVAVGLHLLTDTLIGLAYVAISITLIYLARKAGRSIPFLWAFFAFGVFIIACGLTHFAAALTLWEPWYWLSGGIKYITAVASVGTAIAIPPLVPKVLAIVAAARVSEERRLRLELSNQELGETLDEAQRVREMLQHELASRQDNLEQLALEVAQRRRETEQALRVREEFLSIAAHELKTPLTSIKASAQLLNRALDRLDVTDSGIARLRVQQLSQIKRLEDLVADLLESARIQQGRLDLHPEAFRLGELVDEVTERFEHESYRTEGHQLVTTVPDALVVSWDRSRMDQVLSNLLSNALKYSPGGGMVSVTAVDVGDQIQLEVRDEGIGISDEEQRELFQPFSRTATSHMVAEGTGLGLYISRNIVEQHGGQITVRSRLGEGSCFTIIVPTVIKADGDAYGVESG